jgi:hypothetical protein
MPEVPVIGPDKPEEPITDQDDTQDDFRAVVQGDLIRGRQQEIGAKSRINQRHDERKVLHELLDLGFGGAFIGIAHHKNEYYMDMKTLLIKKPRLDLGFFILSSGLLIADQNELVK